MVTASRARKVVIDDVTRKCNLLHIVGFSVLEQNGDWTITRIYSGSLVRMQAQYSLNYL